MEKYCMGKLAETIPSMGSKEKQQHETLNFLRKTIMGENIYMFRPDEAPFHWIQWFDPSDQLVGKASKPGETPANCSKGSPVSTRTNFDNEFGRGLQSPLFKFPETVVALAKDLPGWPIVSHKVQMHKCDKCSQEFFSPLNHWRHMRSVHRRPLVKGKSDDLKERRFELAAFWDKLSPEKAREILSSSNISFAELSVNSIIQNLSAIIHQPGMLASSQSYAQIAVALLDIVQGKASRFPLQSEELFRILEDASERNLLCGLNSPSMQRSIICEERGKVGVQTRNLVATLGFLIELSLVKAWTDDKDAEALQIQRQLVEEEEAAHKKQAKIQERKRLKKMRQKCSKDREHKGNEQLTCEGGAEHNWGDTTAFDTPVNVSIRQDEEQLSGQDGTPPTFINNRWEGDVEQDIESEVGSISARQNAKVPTITDNEWEGDIEQDMESQAGDTSANTSPHAIEVMEQPVSFGNSDFDHLSGSNSPHVFGMGFSEMDYRCTHSREKSLAYRKYGDALGRVNSSHAVWTRKLLQSSPFSPQANAFSADTQSEEVGNEDLPNALIVGSVTIPLNDLWPGGGRSDIILPLAQPQCLTPPESEHPASDLDHCNQVFNFNAGSPFGSLQTVAIFQEEEQTRSSISEDCNHGGISQDQACSILSLLVERWKVATSSFEGHMQISAD